MKFSRLIPLGSILIIIILGSAVYINSPGRIFNFTPDRIKADNDKARAYEKMGMHEGAIKIYNQMLEKNPNNPNVYVNIAAIQIIKGNPYEAICLCEKAIKIDPENGTAHNNLAVAYYLLGRYSIAIKHCDLAVKYGYKVKPELIQLLKPHRGQEDI